jgi:hypothetical protein
MKPFYKMTDLELREWSNEFAVALQTYGGLFAIPPALAQKFSDDTTDFGGHVDSVADMRRLLDAELALRDSSRETLLRDAGTLAARIKASPAATPSLIKTMGLIPDEKPRRTVPLFAPTNPQVSTKTNGTTIVKWSSGNNAPRCTYIVEARRPTESEWRMVALTNRLKIDLTDTVVGETTYYRVVAQRGDRRSEPSDIVVAYGDSDSLAA